MGAFKMKPKLCSRLAITLGGILRFSKIKSDQLNCQQKIRNRRGENTKSLLTYWRFWRFNHRQHGVWGPMARSQLKVMVKYFVQRRPDKTANA